MELLVEIIARAFMTVITILGVIVVLLGISASFYWIYLKRLEPDLSKELSEEGGKK